MSMNTRAQERYADDNRNPLRQVGILKRVLDYVGPGHWYFVSTVSKLWKDLYERVESQRMVKDFGEVQNPFT
jgi:hypothetical protein